MAVTKILPRNSRLDVAIKYVLNGDKTDHQVLTARINCDPGWEYRQMMDTKEELGKTGGRLAYHIIQSLNPLNSTFSKVVIRRKNSAIYKTICASKQLKSSNVVVIDNDLSRNSEIIPRVFTTKIGLFRFHPLGEVSKGINKPIKLTVEYSYSFENCCNLLGNICDFRIIACHKFDKSFSFMMIFKGY